MSAVNNLMGAVPQEILDAMERLNSQQGALNAGMQSLGATQAAQQQQIASTAQEVAYSRGDIRNYGVVRKKEKKDPDGQTPVKSGPEAPPPAFHFQQPVIRERGAQAGDAGNERT